MLFTADFFRRMLSNVVPGVAFYPIIFSQYDPHYVGQISDDFEIQENSGFWREYGYGMVALYKSDFDKAGGFDVKIEGNVHASSSREALESRGKRDDHFLIWTAHFFLDSTILWNFRLGSRRCLSCDKCDKQRRKCLQGKWSKPCTLIPHQTLWPRIKSTTIWWMFKGMFFNLSPDIYAMAYVKMGQKDVGRFDHLCPKFL